MAGVIGSVGKFAIFFVASLKILSQLGFNLGPLLASAGIVASPSASARKLWSRT